MPWDPSLRMSDDDRERIVEELRDHASTGRITMDEFQERMEAAYKAQTFRDAQPLLADLPVDLATLVTRPTSAPAAPTSSPLAAPEQRHPSFSGPLRFWASISAFFIVIWALSSISSGHVDNFWPVWPMAVFGAFALLHGIKGVDPRHQEERRRRHEARQERHRMRLEYQRAREEAKLKAMRKVNDVLDRHLGRD